jgi:hypothetical protein
MRRSLLVPDTTAADVDDAHGIQSLIRVFPPPETSAFTSEGQVSSKSNVNKPLQPAECITGISVTKIVYPSHHNWSYQFHKFFGADWRSSGCQIFQPVTNLLLSTFRWKNVNGILSCCRTLALNEIKPYEIKTIGQFRNMRFILAQGKVQSFCDRFKCS